MSKPHIRLHVERDASASSTGLVWGASVFHRRTEANDPHDGRSVGRSFYWARPKDALRNAFRNYEHAMRPT